MLLCRAEDGEVVGQASAPHPSGSECDPRDWWSALLRAGDGLLDRAAAIAVAGQQHGMVVLDGDDHVIRPGLFDNTKRLRELISELEALSPQVVEQAEGWARP